MKRTVAIVLGLAAMTAGAFAQDAAIDKALTAAPAQLKAGATVIKWKSDFTYDTLKQGTNDLVCYDKSGMPLNQPFSVECTDKGNLPRAAQNLKAEAAGDRKAVNEALNKEEADGTRVKPVYGSVWYHAMGPDAEHVRMHMTVAVPGATKASTGLPDSRGNTVWIMNAGTSTAHLMIPGE